MSLPLPPSLLVPATVPFCTASIDLNKAVRGLLGLPKSQSLETYVPLCDTWSMASRRDLQDLVRKDSALCQTYERLIREVVCPVMAASLPRQFWNEVGDANGANEGDEAGRGATGPDAKSGDETGLASEVLLSASSSISFSPPSPSPSRLYSCNFYYQFPPTLRIQAAGCKHFRRLHRDAEYGHQPGEVNFWLPLTDATAGRASLWLETVPGSGNMRQLELRCGEIGRFYGVDVRHTAPPNLTGYCRLSLDFRVAPAASYDVGWSLLGREQLKIKHEMRAACVCSMKSIASMAK